MTESGHRYRFPMTPRQFIWRCVIKQLLFFPKLIRYVRIRAKYAATGEGGGGAYEVKGPQSKLLVVVGLLYLATLALTLVTLVQVADPILLSFVPVALLAAIVTFYALVSARYFRPTFIRPDVSARWTILSRVCYLSGLFCTVAWLKYLTGWEWGLYYGILWLVPLGTTFSFFMLLRQIVQHGHADQGRFSNTRTFLVGRLIRWSVFPMGMEYHLPHHLFPMVPHFRIRQLHELLLETDPYHNEGVVVEGYFFHRRPQQHPTVLELMSRS
jgi:Fatty acid desaturase